MRRMGWLLGVVLLSFFPASAASSGGFDVLRFEREYYVPGELARGSTRFWVEVATVEEREPYYAYLLPEGKTFEPPVIPEAAIPLGPLTIDLLPEGEANPAEASLEFSVPQVASGDYQVVLCNRPCRDDVVGALIGGSIHVVATAERARLLNFEAKLERRLERRIYEMTEDWRGQLEGFGYTTEGLDARLADLAVQAEREEGIDADLIARLDRAETELLSMERRLTDLATTPSGWPSHPIHWVILASGWLAALAAAWLWLRNARRVRHPLTASTNPDGANGHGWAASSIAPDMTAASRRAMSLADNGWRRPDS